VPGDGTAPPRSAICHVSIGTGDLARAAAFYDAVLAPLGIARIMRNGDAIAWGRAFPEFWVGVPIDGRPAAPGNGTHIAFLATGRAQVDAFHAAALAAGGTCEGPPGPRPHYGAPYYGAFVRDPDGHKVEATFWDAAAEAA
jgi:catechol 2,3-dioxygenase-like lactoylglutathione lyase family enzyme